MAVAISGTPVEINSATNTGSQSVTVPASCTGVFVGVGGFQGASFFSGGTVTLGGVTVPNYAPGGDANGSWHQHATFFLEGSLASGAQTLAWDWSGTSAPTDGALIVVAFITGGATASAVRDAQAKQSDALATSFVTPTITALTNDLIVAFGEQFNSGAVTFTWTNATKVADYHVGSGGYRATSASLATASPTGNQTVTLGSNQSQDGGVTGLSIKPPSGGGTTDTFAVSTTGKSTPGFGLAGMTDTVTVSATGHSAPAFTPSGTDVISLAATGSSTPTFATRGTDVLTVTATGHAAPAFALAPMTDVVAVSTTGHSAPAFTVSRAGQQTVTLATTGRSAPVFALAGMADTAVMATTGRSAPTFSVFVPGAPSTVTGYDQTPVFIVTHH